MLGFLTSLLSGGATGLLGVGISAFADYFKRKQEHKQNLELKRLDIEMMDKEWQYRERAADREAETRIIESADDLKAASYKHDAATYSTAFKVTKVWNKTALVMVDVIRGVIRPALTVMLIWMVWDVMGDVEQIMLKAGVEAVNVEKAMEIYALVISRVLFCAEACVVWWFGVRQLKK